MSRSGTAFRDLVVVPDPRSEVDHYHGNHVDPRLASEVLPDPVPPGSVSPAFRSPRPEELSSAPIAETHKAARFHEHSFRWGRAAMAALDPAIQLVEIARWRVPAGNFGIVSAIWTAIGVNIAINPETELEIGLNLPWQPWLHEILLGRIRWWLRLEAGREHEELYPVWLSTPNELPGDPYLDLATWNDQRFGWGYHSRQPLRLLVPESSTLRLFVGKDVLVNEWDCKHVPCPEGYVCRGGICVPEDIPDGDEELLAGGAELGGAERIPAAPSSAASSWETPYTETAALSLRAAGFEVPDPSSSPEAAAAAAEGYALQQQEIVTPTFAGRITGTLQAYRKNPAARTAARRGM